jgi:hypothetical protein
MLLGHRPVGPEAIDYDWLTADSPLEALHKLHAEALGFDAVHLVDGHLAFANTADQELCAGAWRITDPAQRHHVERGHRSGAGSGRRLNAAGAAPVAVTRGTPRAGAEGWSARS